MRLKLNHWLLVVIVVVLAAGGACEKRVKYGVVSFRFCPGFRLPHTLTKYVNGEDKTFVILHFRGPPGKYSMVRFMLQDPSGDKIPPLYYMHSSHNEWYKTIDLTEGTTAFVNAILGDLNVELLYAIEGSPSTEYVLVYFKAKYTIIKQALKH